MAVGRQRRDSWRGDARAGWLALALGTLVVFALLALLIALVPSVDRVDFALSAAVRSMRTPLLTKFAIAVTQLGSVWVVTAVALGCAFWLAWRRSVAGLVYLFSTVAVGWFLGNVIVKALIHRARPEGVALIALPAGYSMPSGHALASFLVYASLVTIVMIETPPGRHVKRWIFAAAAIAIVLVGWSRVYLGVHWAGDVLGAWLFGFAWWSFTTATYFGAIRSGVAKPMTRG